MPNARLTPLMLLALLGACHGGEQRNGADQNIGLDDAVPANQLDPNAAIETLPADESSTTPSNQLQNGFDNPDVNDTQVTNTQ